MFDPVDLLSYQLEYKDDRQLIKVMDVLGREVSPDTEGTILYIYDVSKIFFPSFFSVFPLY